MKDPMVGLIGAAFRVRNGGWIAGAPSHIFAELLAELERDGWALVHVGHVEGQCSKCERPATHIVRWRDSVEQVCGTHAGAARRRQFGVPLSVSRIERNGGAQEQHDDDRVAP